MPVTMPVGAAPCEKFHLDFLHALGDIAELGGQDAEHLRSKRRQALIIGSLQQGKKAFDIPDALTNDNAEFREMCSDDADEAAALADQQRPPHDTM